MTSKHTLAHNMEEYKNMFGLTDLIKYETILEYPSGVSTFNQEMTAEGCTVMSCDPMYCQDSSAIEQSLQNHPQSDRVASFLNDFKQGLQEKRYFCHLQDLLACADFQFDVALCPHYVFADNNPAELDKRIETVKELCRVAKECRIYPLNEPLGEVNVNIGYFMKTMQDQDYGMEVIEVADANAMMRVWALECPVLE